MYICGDSFYISVEGPIWIRDAKLIFCRRYEYHRTMDLRVTLERFPVLEPRVVVSKGVGSTRPAGPGAHVFCLFGLLPTTTVTGCRSFNENQLVNWISK